MGQLRQQELLTDCSQSDLVRMLIANWPKIPSREETNRNLGPPELTLGDLLISTHMCVTVIVFVGHLNDR